MHKESGTVRPERQYGLLSGSLISLYPALHVKHLFPEADAQFNPYGLYRQTPAPPNS